MSKPGCKPYKWVKAPEGHPYATKKGLIQQHRLVAEQIVGRYLKPEEVVHHKDENTLNNDVSNLMVFATASDHSKYHGGWKVYEENNVWHAAEIPKYGICPVCHKTFVLNFKEQKYCSRRCVGKNQTKILNESKAATKVNQLQDLLYEFDGNFTALAKTLGISSNAIVNRLRRAGEPYHSVDYRLCF